MGNFSPLPPDVDEPVADRPMMELTARDWEGRVVQATGKVLVCFSAPWCKYCRELMPVLEVMSENGQYPGVLFGRVSTDRERELVRRYQVRGIPQLLVFDRSGEPAHRFEAGVVSEADIAAVLGFRSE